MLDKAKRELKRLEDAAPPDEIPSDDFKDDVYNFFVSADRIVPLSALATEAIAAGSCLRTCPLRSPAMQQGQADEIEPGEATEEGQDAWTRKRQNIMVWTETERSDVLKGHHLAGGKSLEVGA